MICDTCKREFLDDARFCAGCGSRLVAHANAVVDSLSRIDPIPLLDGERRVVTILISDLSGFTAMGERLDPETVADIMRTIKQEGTKIIEAHGGIVNQFIGDEIVSVFGLPTAGDDDARRAVSAALALHDRVARLGNELPAGSQVSLAMHSGIQTGLVIAQVDDDRNGVYELTGDTINTAARLLSLADSGAVLIGDATMHQVQGLVEVEDAGLHEARGKANPIGAFRVIRALTDRTRFDASREIGLTPFTGRDAEMSILLDSARAAFSERGNMIVVEGEAGTGKSRLCHEFVRRVALRHPDVIVLQGRCQAYGSITPYLPFVQLVREALGVERNTPVHEVLRIVPDAVPQLSPQLVDRIPAYLHLLSALTVDELPPGWRDDRLPEMLQRACVDLVRAIASTRPCIVKLDDWHWADSTSRVTLTRLIEALGGMNALVLIAQRPTNDIGEAQFDNRLTVDVLDAGQTKQMIQGQFGVGDVQQQLAERIHERTLGNPFFVEEVCAALVVSETTAVIDDCLVAVKTLDLITIPTTVQAVVLGRIDALPTRPKQILRAASVIGREFTRQALERLFPDDDLTEPLRLVHERGLIEPMPTHDDQRFRFRHVITQSVAYDSVLLRARTDVHRAIANGIEAEQSDEDQRQQKNVEALARHYLGAGDNARAIEYLEASGAKAMGRFSVAEARSRFRHALDVSRLDPDDVTARRARARLAVRWAETCVYAPTPEQVTLLEQVLDEAIQDVDLRNAALLGYWINWLQHSIGEQVAAESGTRLMLQQLGDDDTTPVGEALQSLLGMILTASRQPDEGIERLRRGLQRRDAAYRGGETEEAVSGMHVYGLAQLAVAHADAGNVHEARSSADYALAVTRTVGQRLTEGSVQICRCLAHVLTGDWSEIRTAIRETEQLDPVVITGHVSRMGDILDSFASIQLGAGHGLERLDRAVAAQRNSDQLLALSLGEALLATALVDVGRVADARLHALASVARSRQNDVYGEDIAQAVLLRTCGLAGQELDHRVAEQLASPSISRSRRSLAMVTLAAAQAHAAADERAEASRRIDEAIETMESIGLTGWLARAISARELILSST